MFSFTNSNRTIQDLLFTKQTEAYKASFNGGLPKAAQQLAALVILFLLSPIFMVVAIIIKYESPGGAVFSQVRVGENGRRFKFYKFRSMRISQDPNYVDVSNLKSDRDGVCSKLFSDPRVTNFGRLIRKYSIDELPQLFNVIKGDMVLIGPRPALTQESDKYAMKARERLNAAPGLTGLWQVSGRADTTFDEQIDLDLKYVRNRSCLGDIRILLATIPVVLFGRGAY